MYITLKKSGAYLLRTLNTEAFRKPFPGRVLCGVELNVAERLSWISENCAQTKAETHWKLHRYLWTLNQKISSLDSQDYFMEDQIKCLPGKQIDSPTEGTSLASCMDQLTEEGMFQIISLREEKANILLHLQPCEGIPAAGKVPKRRKFVLQDMFESKGVCDMLRPCQGSKWKSVKQKGKDHWT